MDKLSDALQTLNKHVDFAALAATIDQAAPKAQAGKKEPSAIPNGTDGTDIVIAASL